MRKLLGFSLGAIVLFATIARAQDANAIGSWDITIESPQGTRQALLVIKQDGGKLAGSLKSPNGERPLDSLAVKGNDITFVMTLKAQGQELVITHKGKDEAAKMSGDADFGGLAPGTWS